MAGEGNAGVVIRNHLNGIFLIGSHHSREQEMRYTDGARGRISAALRAYAKAGFREIRRRRQTNSWEASFGILSTWIAFLQSSSALFSVKYWYLTNCANTLRRNKACEVQAVSRWIPISKPVPKNMFCSHLVNWVNIRTQMLG